jgi:hypothetical protein
VAYVDALRAELRFIVECNVYLWQSGGDGSRAFSAPPMYFSDWCCGVGGSSWGAQQAGGVPVAAIESNKVFSACYTDTFGIRPGEDVRTNREDSANIAVRGSLDLVTASGECSRWSQAAEMSGYNDKATVCLWDQLFLRIVLESPRSFCFENVRGMASANNGMAFKWILASFQAAGYVTAWKLGCPSQLGRPFHRVRLHVAAMRIDEARASWWARLDPDQWFIPAAGTRFACIRFILEPLDTPREELERDGAVFVEEQFWRLFVEPVVMPDRSAEAEGDYIDRSFLRGSASSVISHDVLAGPPETFIIGLMGEEVARLDERNRHRLYHINGLGPCFVRFGGEGGFQAGCFYIPAGITRGEHRPAVARGLCKVEMQRYCDVFGLQVPAGTMATNGGKRESATEAYGQIEVPLVSKKVCGSLFQCLDSTRGLAEINIPRSVTFDPEQRSDVLSPIVDQVVAQFVQFARKRDMALMEDPTAKVSVLSKQMFVDFEGSVSKDTLIINLDPYMNAAALGEVWDLPLNGKPRRVQRRPVQTVSFRAALKRGVFRGTSMELLAATLDGRGNYSGSMIAPNRLYISLNSKVFLAAHERTVKDIKDEMDFGCLRAFASELIERVPACIITQSAVPKRVLAHLKWLREGVLREAKMRRIANKAKNADIAASTNAWVDILAVQKTELARLDDMGKHVVAMCAMASAMNRRAKVEAAGKAIDLMLVWRVFMAEGDVARAYRNLRSCPTETWKSMLYTVFPNGDFKWLEDLVLDFGGRMNPGNFMEVAFGLVMIWAAMCEDIRDCTAPEYVRKHMQDWCHRGYTRCERMRPEQFRAFNGRSERVVPEVLDESQSGAVVVEPVEHARVSWAEPVEVVTRSPAEVELENEARAQAQATLFNQPFKKPGRASPEEAERMMVEIEEAAGVQVGHRMDYPRGTLRAALSHGEDVDVCLKMYRLKAYMDDFAVVCCDQGDKRRVNAVRERLLKAGQEVGLPFGDDKWEAGAATEELVSLGLGFDTRDVEDPKNFLPEDTVLELVFLLEELVDGRMGVTVKAMQSLAMKLQRATFVVPVGKLYICGLFAAIRLQDIKNCKGKPKYLKRVRSGATKHQEEVPMVPITKWVRRNAEWWLEYFKLGSPRTSCLLPKADFEGAAQADAALSGFGGFWIVGTVMYFFHGKWSEEEKESFNSTREGSLNINALELKTQTFLLYLGREDFKGHVFMPECDNDTTVVLRESFKARNESMAVLLEEYDQIAAADAIVSHMTHIPGLVNTTSDILSREGEGSEFHAAVANDFPLVTQKINVSEELPAPIRSLSSLL